MHLDDELFHVGYIIGCWLYLLFPGHPEGYTIYMCTQCVCSYTYRERGRVFGQQRNGRHRSSTAASFLCQLLIFLFFWPGYLFLFETQNFRVELTFFFLLISSFFLVCGWGDGYNYVRISLRLTFDKQTERPAMKCINCDGVYIEEIDRSMP